MPSAGKSNYNKANVLSSQTVYFLLDQAPLEIAKVGDEFQLLASDQHGSYLRRFGKDPAKYRPDVVHHTLLNLIDSPLNKAGMLKIYIRTQKNELIDINPQCRLPRSYSRFAGLMVQLLYKLRIRASNSDITLMRMIKNDFQEQLPVNCPIIAFEKSQDEPVKLWQVVPTLTKKISDPICFVVGAFATGDLQVKDLPVEKYLSMSNYGLSAAICCAKICTAYEELWGVL